MIKRRSFLTGAPKAVATTECRSCDQLMTERDDAEEQADKLADCVAGLLGIEIGEHSNMNAPWQNAIDAAEYELDKRKRSPEPAENDGPFVVADGGSHGEHRYRCWRDDGPGWTLDTDEALQFARRKDAEAFCREDEDAWFIWSLRGRRFTTTKGESHG